MSREVPAVGEKPLFWVGSSLKDLMAFPDEVRVHLGTALGAAQFGGKHQNAKPWKGLGSGILEVIEDYRGDTFRAVYTVHFAGAVYVLHAFQKKSKTGIKTSRADQAVISQRLRTAERDYKELYG